MYINFRLDILLSFKLLSNEDFEEVHPHCFDIRITSRIRRLALSDGIAWQEFMCTFFRSAISHQGVCEAFKALENVYIVCPIEVKGWDNEGYPSFRIVEISGYREGGCTCEEAWDEFSGWYAISLADWKRRVERQKLIYPAWKEPVLSFAYVQASYPSEANQWKLESKAQDGRLLEKIEDLVDGIQGH